MINLQLLKEELIRDEGLRLDAYQDSLGFWTIGVGHLMSPDQSRKITQDEAMDLLQLDIQACLKDVHEEVWYLSCHTDEQRRGLLNMRFQLGSAGIRTFKNSLKLIEKQQWSEAGKALRQSTWYKQTPNRAERVIRMIENSSPEVT